MDTRTKHYGERGADTIAGKGENDFIPRYPDTIQEIRLALVAYNKVLNTRLESQETQVRGIAKHRSFSH